MTNNFTITDKAKKKIENLLEKENINKFFRIEVKGGGCSGFQYGFTFDEAVNEDDTTFEKNGVTLLVDSMSFQYLVGAEIDYKRISMAHSLLLKIQTPLLHVVAALHFPLKRRGNTHPARVSL